MRKRGRDWKNDIRSVESFGQENCNRQNLSAIGEVTPSRGGRKKELFSIGVGLPREDGGGPEFFSRLGGKALLLSVDNRGWEGCSLFGKNLPLWIRALFQFSEKYSMRKAICIALLLPPREGQTIWN